MRSEGSQKQKSFDISKQEVWAAWEQVRANRGAAGVDGVELDEFEKDLRNNLFKVWNRLSSGSYFPQPVRAVEIPKRDTDGVRLLGIPAVVDRVAQTVAARCLEPRVEPVFHPDSYGYRPGRSAHDALDVTRKRCWKADWVVELDIRKFFDTVDHDRLVTALERHLDDDTRWVLLYVRRWITAPVVYSDGRQEKREAGVPQGGPISPILANLFLHYAFDMFMERVFPGVVFARFADDIVIHCDTLGEAEMVLAAVRVRMGEVGLELHPEKTHVTYCADDSRRRKYPRNKFTFLGYTFEARKSMNKHGRMRRNFSPAVSNAALKRMGREVREWKLHTRTDLSYAEIAAWINPIVRGWMHYYGRFYRSRLYGLLTRLNAILLRWVRAKYERLGAMKRALKAWTQVTAQKPDMFAHWAWTMTPFRA